MRANCQHPSSTFYSPAVSLNPTQQSTPWLLFHVAGPSSRATKGHKIRKTTRKTLQGHQAVELTCRSGLKVKKDGARVLSLLCPRPHKLLGTLFSLSQIYEYLTSFVFPVICRGWEGWYSDGGCVKG